jgi:2-polyprenyl-3-methyl-5-hydroxy-6-metoxy-1,4-benzoquinol methylase
MAGHDHGAVPVAHTFDKHYWDQHWQHAHEAPSDVRKMGSPNPYLVDTASVLPPGTALDAGCGDGSEAIWLATNGWQVTAADVSAAALARAAERAAEADLVGSVTWIEADLTVWRPAQQFDFVTTNYAHPAMPQLDFYARIAEWVAPGGTLLIVGHLHHSALETEGQHPPATASVTLSDVTARLDKAEWEIGTAEENSRAIIGRELPLQDVVVRAVRRT